jgi:hypothetical protein
MRRPGLPPGATPAELRKRLADLRETLAFLCQWAEFGAYLREKLTAAGSPTWAPCDDLLWEDWIRRQGDDYARSYLAELDAGAQTEEGEKGPASASEGLW